MRMTDLPFFQFDADPETVYAESDDGQQQPKDPLAEKLRCRTIKFETLTIDNRMFRFPMINHAIRPGQTDT